jgi:hypothetical protein
MVVGTAVIAASGVSVSMCVGGVIGGTLLEEKYGSGISIRSFIEGFWLILV